MPFFVILYAVFETKDSFNLSTMGTSQGILYLLVVESGFHSHLILLCVMEKIFYLFNMRPQNELCVDAFTGTAEPI